MRPAIHFWLAVTVILVGCGAADSPFDAGTTARSKEAAPMADEAGGPGQAVPPEGAKLKRQIIYRAEMNLVVESFDAAARKVQELADAHEGFVSDSRVDGSAGTPRRGQWTVRVPSEKYGPLLEALKDVGEVTSLQTGTEDVSAEYYDVEARIRNRKAEEDRLIQLLAEQTGKLEDVLAVEKELSRVREEAERLQGRLNVLKDLVALSTVTVRVQEVQGFVPAHSPSLGTRIARAWQGSLSAMRIVGEAVLIAAIAFAPWMVVLLAPIIAILLVRKRLSRRAV